MTVAGLRGWVYAEPRVRPLQAGCRPVRLRVETLDPGRPTRRRHMLPETTALMCPAVTDESPACPGGCVRIYF